MNFDDLIPNRLAYYPGFLPRLFATRLMGQLQDECLWHNERLKVRGGLEVPFPRLVAWHGDPGVSYRYSGVDHAPADWTPGLNDVRTRLKELFPDELINGCLLNWYRDGRDSIGRHGDREDDLVPDSPIMCVTLGTTRKLIFRENRTKYRLDVSPEHGSLLIMYGDCQRTWTHEIKKQPDVQGQRISLTFRSVRT